MSYLFHHLLTSAVQRWPDNPSLAHKSLRLTYSETLQISENIASALVHCGLQRYQRVAIYLPKQVETVATMFATSLVGGVFVPVNPVLKAPQVAHILGDCSVRILITSRARLSQLTDQLCQCPDLRTVILVDGPLDPDQTNSLHCEVCLLNELLSGPKWGGAVAMATTDADMAAILYTSGSTGKPKGVVLSHRNLVAGALSVASYIGNQANDRVLAALPLSFDAGLSQITTAFARGACCYLLDYLLPADVMKLVVKEKITGITAVPPLWHQIASLKWEGEAGHSLRYFANTGGHMPAPLLQRLREIFPAAKPFLMYGLTEAFRSTYLDPEQVDLRPGSIGKAIPNAEILVLREDGSQCEPNEVGELVHRGPLVSMGYWNDPERTAVRFKPIPKAAYGLVFDDLAVWSGDRVRRDEEGFLYFVGRQDEMIKTSGYRVSPAEIEEIVYQSGLVSEAVALGIHHEKLGQAILLLITTIADEEGVDSAVLSACRKSLPNFMVPLACVTVNSPLPRNPNGKFDRRRLADDFADYFVSTTDAD